MLPNNSGAHLVFFRAVCSRLIRVTPIGRGAIFQKQKGIFLARHLHSICLLSVAVVYAAGMSGTAAPLAEAAQAAAKTKAKPSNPLDIKRLDAKMEDVRESFLRETVTLIKSYEEVGQLGRAKMLLEALQKLDPKNEPVKVKLEQLNAQMLNASQFEFELEVDKSWQAVGMVMKDQLIRIKMSGEYKLATAFASGPDGLSTDNPAEDMIPHIAMGAVMAVIAPAGAGNVPNANKSDKPPKPFTIGSSYEKHSDRDGVLYLKVNVPPGSKCTGQLTAQISGVLAL